MGQVSGEYFQNDFVNVFANGQSIALQCLQGDVQFCEDTGYLCVSELDVEPYLNEDRDLQVSYQFSSQAGSSGACTSRVVATLIPEQRVEEGSCSGKNCQGTVTFEDL